MSNKILRPFGKGPTPPQQEQAKPFTPDEVAAMPVGKCHCGCQVFIKACTLHLIPKVRWSDSLRLAEATRQIGPLPRIFDNPHTVCAECGTPVNMKDIERQWEVAYDGRRSEDNQDHQAGVDGNGSDVAEGLSAECDLGSGD
jgi:hypothetical protein